MAWASEASLACIVNLAKSSVLVSKKDSKRIIRFEMVRLGNGTHLVKGRCVELPRHVKAKISKIPL